MEWGYIGLYLRIQLTASGRLTFSFAPVGVRAVTDIPCILALPGSIRVVFNFRGLGRSVHFLGLKSLALSEAAEVSLAKPLSR